MSCPVVVWCVVCGVWCVVCVVCGVWCVVCGVWCVVVSCGAVWCGAVWVVCWRCGGGGGADGAVNEMCVHIPSQMHVPVDTAPGPVPVYRALRNPPRNSSNLGAKTLSMSCNCG